MQKIILLGEITIQQAEDSFAEAIFLLIERNRERLDPYMSWTKSIGCISDQLYFYKKAVKDWNSNIAYHYIIKNRGIPVGAISVHSINPKQMSCELGFWIDKQAEGKNIIFSAILALEGCLAEHGFEVVRMRINRKNLRSTSRAYSLGYQLVPELAGATIEHFVKYL